MIDLLEGEDCICEKCGDIGIVQIDPFNAEMNMDYDLHELCDYCVEQSKMEI